MNSFISILFLCYYTCVLSLDGSNHGFGTNMVHAGCDLDPETGSIIPSISLGHNHYYRCNYHYHYHYDRNNVCSTFTRN